MIFKYHAALENAFLKLSTLIESRNGDNTKLNLLHLVQFILVFHFSFTYAGFLYQPESDKNAERLRKYQKSS